MAVIITAESKHVVVGPELLLVKNQSELRRVQTRRKKFVIGDMTSGKYTFIVRVFFLRPSGVDSALLFRYKLGMHKGEKQLPFRAQDRPVKYLSSALDYVTTEHLQLTLTNAFGQEDVVLRKLGSSGRRALLRPGETQKCIVAKQQLANFEICYEIKGEAESGLTTGRSFHAGEVVHMLGRLAREPDNARLLEGVVWRPNEIRNVLASPGTILDEQYVKIWRFEIENADNIKVHDQKCFVLSYKLSSKLRFERSKYFVELKYASSRLCVLGEVRFALNDFSEEELLLEGRADQRGRIRGEALLQGVLLHPDQERLPGLPRAESGREKVLQVRNRDRDQ